MSPSPLSDIQKMAATGQLVRHMKFLMTASIALREKSKDAVIVVGPGADEEIAAAVKLWLEEIQSQVHQPSMFNLNLALLQKFNAWMQKQVGDLQQRTPHDPAMN